MTDNEFNDYVSTVTKIVTLAMAVAATIATPASIAIVLMASSQRVVGAPMPRMTPEAVAEPRADYLAIDRFIPLERRPRILRVSAPGDSGHLRDRRLESIEPDEDNRKRLLWFPLRLE